MAQKATTIPQCVETRELVRSLKKVTICAVSGHWEGHHDCTNYRLKKEQDNDMVNKKSAKILDKVTAAKAKPICHTQYTRSNEFPGTHFQVRR